MKFNPDNNFGPNSDHHENQNRIDFEYAYEYYKNTLDQEAQELVSLLPEDAQNLLQKYITIQKKYEHYQSLLEDHMSDHQSSDRESLYLEKLIDLQATYTAIKTQIDANPVIQDLFEKQRNIRESILPKENLLPHEQEKIKNAYERYLEKNYTTLIEHLNREDQAVLSQYLILLRDHGIASQRIEDLDVRKNLANELSHIEGVHGATEFTHKDETILNTLTRTLSSLNEEIR